MDYDKDKAYRNGNHLVVFSQDYANKSVYYQSTGKEIKVDGKDMIEISAKDGPIKMRYQVPASEIEIVPVTECLHMMDPIVAAVIAAALAEGEPK